MSGRPASRPLRRLAALVGALAATITAAPPTGLFFVTTGLVSAADPVEASKLEKCRARLVHSSQVPDVALAAGVRLGGLSDLSAAQGAGRAFCWAITDRGPNGTIERDGEKLRTLLEPTFTPSLVLLRIDPAPDAPATIAVERILPLTAGTGKPLTGLPTGGPGHLAVMSADGSAELAPDPDGVDTEAVAELPDGTLWIAEEYGPSLLKVGADGRVIERHVPVGSGRSAAAVPDRETIPAVYSKRQDNRGFEAMAAAPDGSRLWVLLQSPLDNPGKKAAKKTGNVRLLGFDPAAGRPVAEHLYRLGDPTDRNYLTKGAPPDDGKLCAMAMLADGGLLVLEQDDEGLARLYAVSLTGVTDTLARRQSSGDSPTLEEIRDLTEAGIVPAGKRLVADLGPLREAMTAQADGGRPLHGPLKLEGLAVVDDRHVLVANDDDFGVHGKKGGRRRSLFWLVELDHALGAIPSR
ncbi:MAG: esterase-like activity of phytase family protein [Planctomycetota bacterium]